jgi:hypothetical protein
VAEGRVLMRLGISYAVFEGEELLEPVVRGIRPLVSHVSVVYQPVSYHGNPCAPGLVPALEGLLARGVIDELVRFDSDLSLVCKANEAGVRNLGLECSRRAGCTHHISADVDEFYVPEQLAFVMAAMGGHDSSIVPIVNYYKRPVWRIEPLQGHRVSFIHPVGVSYDLSSEPPLSLDRSRRLSSWAACRVFEPHELVVHHMSFVRRDIRRKLANNSNWTRRDLDKFVAGFDTYQLGDRLCVGPDFINRRTVLAEDLFGLAAGGVW